MDLSFLSVHIGTLFARETNDFIPLIGPTIWLISYDMVWFIFYVKSIESVFTAFYEFVTHWQRYHKEKHTSIRDHVWWKKSTIIFCPTACTLFYNFCECIINQICILTFATDFRSYFPFVSISNLYLKFSFSKKSVPRYIIINNFRNDNRANKTPKKTFATRTIFTDRYFWLKVHGRKFKAPMLLPWKNYGP